MAKATTTESSGFPKSLYFRAMFVTYEETLQYLYDALPMFQRIGAAALKNDLSNTLKLCTALGNPERKFKTVHIAGTNGKGSSAHMLASVLQQSGYKTGLYTSPHLKEFTERIRIDGVDVPHNFIIDFVNRVRPLIEELKPSFFEITVAMAFDHFARNNVDIAVIEVGLGGRLDSTNVIHPELSLITNIGWDHKNLLGDTLEKIAHEKAGIIKNGVPVVISERQGEIDTVFIETSAARSAPIFFASDSYHAVPRDSKEYFHVDIYKDGALTHKDLALDLRGFYQCKNVCGVIMAADKLRERGWEIAEEDLIKGLQRVVPNTGLKGRWQVLGEHPLMICDTAHNAEGIQEVVHQLAAQSYEHLHIVFGAVSDKDIHAVLQLLPKQASYYFCQAKLPRAMDATQLAHTADLFGLQGTVVPDVNEAIAQAVQNASSGDMIFIGGSSFVVAEIKNL